MFSQGQLRYFVTVAEEGQITRAAKRLRLAQPALSQAIAQLESELDIELLERHPRGVTLTAGGEAFLVKARAVLAAEADTAQVAMSLRRAAMATITVGFIGPPPVLSTPKLFTDFAERNPHAQVRFQDLPFPAGDTSAWMTEVDVAFCQTPAIEHGLNAREVRVEPRAVMLRRDHPLAQRAVLDVGDVIEETFIGYHPRVQKPWAGFHSLDDHRAGPPARTTDDHARSALEMLGIISTAEAITTLPLRDAKLAAQALADMVAVPLGDAMPATISLVWRGAGGNALVDDLLACATDLDDGDDDL
jgi:DNA-binding transcriptional LysR family regulator